MKKIAIRRLKEFTAIHAVMMMRPKALCRISARIAKSRERREIPSRQMCGIAR